MKKKLGEILIASGAVSRADIEEALQDQNAGEPARLGDLLVTTGKLTPLQLAQALSQQYGVKFTHLSPAPAEVLEAVPLDVQRRYRFVPIKLAGASISIALADLAHASSDVLPLLKKRWATVNLFVAPADEIDAAHAQAQAALPPRRSPAPPPPRVSPAPAPPRVSPAPPPPAPRKSVVAASEDELFAALDLALPSEPAPPAPRAEEPEDLEILTGLDPLPAAEEPVGESFELEMPPLGEEEEVRFEAAPAALLRGDLAPASVELEVAISESGLRDTESGLRATVAAPAPPVAEDQPFFETAPQAVPIATLEDQAFLPDVPISSGSSLARLVIQPDPAPLTMVPPVDLPRPPPPAAPAPPPPRPGAFAGRAVPSASASGLTPIPAGEPVGPRVPAGAALPAWLQSPGPAASPAPAAPTTPATPAEWTGALDEVAPSRLVHAVTRALLRRGLITEQDILDALPPRKKP